MVKKYKNPLLTVDIIIEIQDAIVLIKRKNSPFGWAIPGGFVDYGESLETAAIREAKEETSLDIKLVKQFQAYSDPSRDPRHHTVTVVYIAKAMGTPKAADDAERSGLFAQGKLPVPIVFDHKNILNDYFRYKKGDPEDTIFYYT